MRLNERQLKALEPYASNFETAVRAKWARHPGSLALDIISATYNEVTGVSRKINKGCQRCIMRLLTDMGKIYLDDIAELNRAKETTPPAKKPRTRKKTIKTESNGNKTN